MGHSITPSLYQLDSGENRWTQRKKKTEEDISDVDMVYQGGGEMKKP